MKTASIRELRTQFPRVRRLLEREGEVLVTDRGRCAYVLRVYSEPAPANSTPVDYFRRLTTRQARPLSRAASRALDEADRGER